MNEINGAALTVYYDGLCILCSKEMDFYRRRDPKNRIRYMDIAGESFDAKKEGLEGRNFHKYFHAKSNQGKILKGVDAFIEIWKTLGIFKPFTYLAQAPLTSPFFQLGYLGFIFVRPYLPRKKCDTDNCYR